MKTRTFIASALATVFIGGAAVAGDAGMPFERPASAGNSFSQTEMSSAAPFTYATNPLSAMNARVENTQGDTVGYVQSITTQSDGTPQSVVIDVSDNVGSGPRAVIVDASDLLYLENRHVMVTELTKHEIANAPIVR